MVVYARKSPREVTGVPRAGSESKRPRLSKAALAAQTAQVLAKKQTAAKKENVTKATDNLWDATMRLRTQSDSTWTSSMAPLLTATANCFSVPSTTLRDRFMLRLEKARGVAQGSPQRKKLRSNAASQFSELEKRKLYDWLEWKRRKMESASPLELRTKVCLLGVPVRCDHHEY